MQCSWIAGDVEEKVVDGADCGEGGSVYIARAVEDITDSAALI